MTTAAAQSTTAQSTSAKPAAPGPAAARVVVRPLRRTAYVATKRALDASRPLFIRTYDRLGRRDPLAPGTGESPADQVLADLEARGFARWPGYFSAEQVAELNRAFERVLDAPDPGAHWKRVVGVDAHDGRARAFADCAHAAQIDATLAGLFSDERLASLVRRYYRGANTWCRSIMVERLSVTQSPGTWHFDKIFDQVKAMVLLSDVGREHGPIRYKAATHRDRPAFVDLFLHESFKRGAIHGLDYAYPPQPLVERLPHEDLFGVGRAGDVLFFDTLGLHTGTACSTGERRAVVAAYNAQTARNNRLYKLLFPDRAA